MAALTPWVCPTLSLDSSSESYGHSLLWCKCREMHVVQLAVVWGLHVKLSWCRDCMRGHKGQIAVHKVVELDPSYDYELLTWLFTSLKYFKWFEYSDTGSWKLFTQILHVLSHEGNYGQWNSNTANVEMSVMDKNHKSLNLLQFAVPKSQFGERSKKLFLRQRVAGVLVILASISPWWDFSYEPFWGRAK